MSFQPTRWAEVNAYNASSFHFGPIWNFVITTSALSTTQVAWAEVNIAESFSESTIRIEVELFTPIYEFMYFELY